jgi:nuclear transport factor 2 (NTF2) superfamily protein
MTVQNKPASGLDFEVLRRAYEERDPELSISLYADEAEVRIVDHANPPSAPFVLHGKEQIAEYLRDVLGREMTHRIENEVIGENRVAFNLACEYPDGNRVLCAGNLEVRDGKIVRDVSVQAWDE